MKSHNHAFAVDAKAHQLFGFWGLVESLLLSNFLLAFARTETRRYTLDILISLNKTTVEVFL